jgi:hypothetical protein
MGWFMLNYKEFSLICLSIVCILLTILSTSKLNSIEEENTALKDSSIVYKSRAQLYIKMYDELKKKDGVLVKTKDSLIKIKQKSKIKYVEKIKIISKYSVSDMQRYFDERTGKSSNTGQCSVCEDN